MPSVEEHQKAVDILARRRDRAYQDFKAWETLYEEAINALWAAEEEATDDV